MKKAIATPKGQPTQYVNLTQEEIDARNAEFTAAESKAVKEAPYNELKRLDQELPRWAEDFASQGAFTLYGRAAEVKALKEEQRTIIQNREL